MITAGELEKFMKENKIKPEDGIIFIDVQETDVISDLIVYKDKKYDKFRILSKSYDVDKSDNKEDMELCPECGGSDVVLGSEYNVCISCAKVGRGR